MKILMINTVPMERNGITNVICNIVQAINNPNVSVDCVSINKPDKYYYDIFSYAKGHIYVIENRLKCPILYFRKLVRLIKKNEYDCIHAHGNSHTLAIEMLAARAAGCSVRIAHSHNTTCKYKVIDKIMKPIFDSSCTHNIACGKEAGKWLFGRAEFEIFKNGVFTENYRFDENYRKLIRKKYSINENSIVIGHIGNFNDAKNQDWIIEIGKELSRRKIDFTIFLIGTGERLETIKKMVNEYNLEKNVIFTGAIDNVNQYLSAFDCVVMPSFFEGLPLTLIEEQAAGLKCFVSDNITKEVDITGNVDFLSLNDNVENWASTIIKEQKKNNRDKDSDIAIKKIVKKGYDIASESERLLDFYIKICNR